MLGFFSLAVPGFALRNRSRVVDALCKRVVAFYGTSPNAAKTQIWIAICTYVLVAIVRKRLGLTDSLYTILQILSVTLFEKTPILQALSLMPCVDLQAGPSNQLYLQGI